MYFFNVQAARQAHVERGSTARQHPQAPGEKPQPSPPQGRQQSDRYPPLNLSERRQKREIITIL